MGEGGGGLLLHEREGDARLPHGGLNEDFGLTKGGQGRRPTFF